MLGLERILDAHALQDFRREVGQALEADRTTFRQTVANAQDAVVRDADNVAAIGLFGQLAIRRKEHDRRIDRQLLAGVLHLQLHAALELARAQFQHGDTVAVIGVHIGLDLEDKACDFLFRRLYDRGGPCLFGLDCLRWRGKRPKRRQQLIDAVMAQSRAEQDGCHMPFQKTFGLEGLEPAFDQLSRILQFRQLSCVEITLGDGRVDRHRWLMALVVFGAAVALGEGVEKTRLELDHTAETVPRSGRPEQRRRVELQL